ncbi:site-specific integrase [Micromonospora sp. NPDC049679]|uniref:tyrosine-type recombinase/integrase n=1 Tax=Micromonospora sp. NPDC049679 TaxID=3155920 RepID=UPI0033C5921D
MASRTRANGEGSIFPYRNGFAAYVWVTKPDGKRTRKYVYGKTRDVVHDKWIKLHTLAKQGPVATNVPTVANYLTYWLAEVVEPNRAPLTYATYETLARLYILPGIGMKRLDRLSVRDVQTWINQVAKTCQCCGQNKDAQRPATRRRCCAIGNCCSDLPSARTIKGIRAVLRSALSQAQVEELITKNVAGLVKLPAIRRRKGNTWTSDEARTFLESARDVADYLYPAYVLVLVLGLRKGEVLGLTWDHIDWGGWDKNCAEHGEPFCERCRDRFDVCLLVDRQLQRVRRELLHRATKTEESDAPLPLPDICVTALRHRYLRQQATVTAAGERWRTTEMVFTTRYGLPVEPRNFSRSWDAGCARAGVKKITVHDARRTCASLLVDLDVHPRIAMAILRHADFSITMDVYSQASSKATRNALRRIGESLEL